MIDLKKTYSKKFRIQLDESFEIGDRSSEERLWCYQIPCKHGHIAVHGKDTLSGYTSKSRMIPRLESIPGVIVKQRGDSEMTVVFPPNLIEQVADVLQARRRRQLSEEQRIAAAERLSPHRFKVADDARQVSKTDQPGAIEA